MFSITLLDHLRLTFNQVIQRQQAHSQAAHSYRRWNRLLRGAEALLIAAVVFTAAGNAYGRGQVLGIAAAVLAGAALLVLLVRLTFDFDTSAHAHSACSIHLWYMRERYRSLLSDLNDGLIDVAEARTRRDKLMAELRGIYERFPSIQLDGDRKRRPGEGEPAAEDLQVPNTQSQIPKAS